MAGGISIHAIDVASGRPAQGLRVEIWRIENDKIVFQRGYWDRLSFLKAHGLPLAVG